MKILPETRLVIVQLATIVSLALGASTAAQTPDFFGARGMGPGFNQERALLETYDLDRNGWLNSVERTAARVAAKQGANSGPGGFPVGNRAGGPPNVARFGALFGGETVAGRPGRQISSAEVSSGGRAGLYDANTLRTLFIEFDSADWEQELEDFRNTDVEVTGTVIVDGGRYPLVGVSFRGLTSFMTAPTGSKRSFNLSFDLADSKQSLLGYRTLNLLNAASDPTFLRTVLYMQMAREYLPAPKANYLHVVINGESWGIYVNVQQFNSTFTREIGIENGARWKVSGSPMGGGGGLAYLGADVAAYRRAFDIRSKDSDESWAALVNLTRVLNETPPQQLKRALAPLLDVENALRFLALDKALINADGYWTRASDYSLYTDDSGVFRLAPHDVNESLRSAMSFAGMRGLAAGGAASTAGGAAPITSLPVPTSAGPELGVMVGAEDPAKALLYRLLAVPEFKARYLTLVRQIADRWLDWRRLGPIAAKHQALIADEVALDSRKLYSTAAFRQSVDVDRAGTEGMGSPAMSLKTFAALRREYLLKNTAP